MSGFGPPPSENKRRRNADTYEGAAVTVPAEGIRNAPALPDAKTYLPQTQTWYETWTKAPQAAVFTVTDWQRLHMLAPIVNAFWTAPSTKLLAEIRLNESLLRATHLDRMRGRMKVEAPKPSAPKAPPGVTDLTQRRRRLTDAS